jgi:hypothetical protein
MGQRMHVHGLKRRNRRHYLRQRAAKQRGRAVEPAGPLRPTRRRTKIEYRRTVAAVVARKASADHAALASLSSSAGNSISTLTRGEAYLERRSACSARLGGPAGEDAGLGAGLAPAAFFALRVAGAVGRLFRCLPRDIRKQCAHRE